MGQVGDDHREEAKAGTRLKHREQSPGCGRGSDIAQAQGEEGSAAEVQRVARTSYRSVARPECHRGMGQPKAGHQPGRPGAEQHQYGQRPVQAEVVLLYGIRQPPAQARPHRPGAPVEHPGEAVPPANGAGEDNAVERIPQHDPHQQQARRRHRQQ